MQQGRIALTRTESVVHGRPAAEAVVDEAERLGAERVFLLVSGTLNRETDEVRRLEAALGRRFAGLHDDMPAHTPREAVVACANRAREARADLLVTFGGGSVTDGGKGVAICLEHDIDTVEGLEPFRTVVDPETGRRFRPDYGAPRVRQIAVPTTLSGGEFNPRAGITETALRLKQSYMHPGIVPVCVVLDPAATAHTPEWLFLSTGMRAVDHAVETYCSIDANDYSDGAALHALRLLHRALPAVRRDPADLGARLRCLMGVWLSMSGIVTGTRLGASHAIGHVLGGSADVPHGHTSCVMLPNVLAYNAKVNGDRQAALAEAVGRPGEPAGRIIGDLVAALDQPGTLRAVGIDRSDLPRIAENSMLDEWTHTNPRPVGSVGEVMEILERAY